MKKTKKFVMSFIAVLMAVLLIVPAAPAVAEAAEVGAEEVNGLVGAFEDFFKAAYDFIMAIINFFKNIGKPSNPGGTAPAPETTTEEPTTEEPTTEAPDPEGSYPVFTAEELRAAIAEGKDFIVVKESFEITAPIAIPDNASVKIYGKGNTIKRAAAEEEFSMFTVGAGASLTLEAIIADGGAVWTGESDPVLLRPTTNEGLTTAGAIVATAANAAIILEDGAVLQNNDGANAVNLGTRIGATLTLNGGEIINNNSGAGAIWGGGHIYINEGKINGNSSTGLAGAIRMVSSCNLTMTGGEMNHNKAVTNGGAVWGYGASTYTLSGGEIAYNSAACGGAIYTGDSSPFYISGDFELHHNTAADSGAIRFTNRTGLTMTGGKIYDNEANGYDDFTWAWNLGANISGGEIADDFTLVSGLGVTIGAADITGVVHFQLGTTHNTVYLTNDFNGFKFTVAAGDNFAVFNMKPAAGYEYAEGDENKLVCQNEGYETYWDAATATFRLRAAE